MNYLELSPSYTAMKREKALDSVLNSKRTIHKSYQEGWRKALENYDRLFNPKRKHYKVQST